jgi:hypothetical protein
MRWLHFSVGFFAEPPGNAEMSGRSCSTAQTGQHESDGTVRRLVVRVRRLRRTALVLVAIQIVIALMYFRIDTVLPGLPWGIEVLSRILALLP